MTEQQSQQFARQDAALAIRFGVKPVGTRTLLRRQDVHQAREVVLARTPDVDLILRQDGARVVPHSTAVPMLSPRPEQALFGQLVPQC